MSTLSGVTGKKIMTNTWLDKKISPIYQEILFFNIDIVFNIYLTKRTSAQDFICRKCSYRAIDIIDNRILYGIIKCEHMPGANGMTGIVDSFSNMSNTKHFSLRKLGLNLSSFLLPIISRDIVEPPTIDNILELAEFQFTSDMGGLLAQNGYNLNTIIETLSDEYDITVNNRTDYTSYEKSLYYVSNGGVSYGGNKMNYDGTPPSLITPYIEGEPNNSKKAITDIDFKKIFTGTSGSSKKCVREDVNVFNYITLYPIVGEIYKNYYGPLHSNNVNCTSRGVDLNITYDPTIIPPTLTGIQYWMEKTKRNYPDVYGSNQGYQPINVYLSLNEGGGENLDNIYMGGTSSQNNFNYETLVVFDIGWNYSSNKSKYKFSSPYFFKIFARNDNDGYGATLGISNNNGYGLSIQKDYKIYPYDIFGRQPYITPSILQDSKYNIFQVSYLPYDYALEYVKHPTLNRNLNSSDGLESMDDLAVMPIVYIPSTMKLKSVGACTTKLTYDTNGYPVLSISHSKMQFEIYKYAYGNRTSVKNNNNLQKVNMYDIYDISDDNLLLNEFTNQLNNNASLKFTGNVKYKLTYNDGSVSEESVTYNPECDFTTNIDNDGNILISGLLNLNKTLNLYKGRKPKSAIISSVTVTMKSTGVEGVLLGDVTETERTTNIDTVVCIKGGGGSSSGKSLSFANTINDDGIDMGDYTIGSFDEFNN